MTAIKMKTHLIYLNHQNNTIRPSKPEISPQVQKLISPIKSSILLKPNMLNLIRIVVVYYGSYSNLYTCSDHDDMNEKNNQ